MSFDYLIFLRDHGYAQFLHEVDDERVVCGLYWERFGVRYEGVDWWFGWRRNQLMEWMPQAEKVWKALRHLNGR
jgi:hypothetical protein